MAIPDDYKEIIGTLAAATKERRLRWKTTVLGVELVLTDSVLQLWKGRLNNSSYVTFGLADHDREELDTWAVSESEADYDCMLTLFLDAQRLAFNIPQRLAHIRDEIHRAAGVMDDRTPATAPPRHKAASDCDASLPSTVTMR